MPRSLSLNRSAARFLGAEERFIDATAIAVLLSSEAALTANFTAALALRRRRRICSWSTP
jgi:hypothetical protein